MKKMIIMCSLAFGLLATAQVKDTTIKEITKKFVMIDAKIEGDVINVRYDSIKVQQLTMKQAVMSYLRTTMAISDNILNKRDYYRNLFGPQPTLDQNKVMDRLLDQSVAIGERQKVLALEKYEKANDTKKVLIHSKAYYYLKLDDDVTDGSYEKSYYFTLQGKPIDNIYEFFLENIN